VQKDWREEKEVMSMLAERSGCARRARGASGGQGPLQMGWCTPRRGVGLVGRVRGGEGREFAERGRKEGRDVLGERRLAR